MTNRYYLRMQDIVTRYGFDQQVISDSITIHNILMDIFKTRCQDKKTALWGAGRNNSENSHASVIIKKYTTYIQSLSYLIDSLPQLWGKEFMGYPIISPEDIEKSGIEIVIIASKVQGDSIKKGLEKYAPNCEYIDIYEELKNRGLVVYHKFYEESSVYTVIHTVRQELTKAKDTNKPDLLKKLISLYMGIKDISYALEYAAEYVRQQYENWESMEHFISVVKELVSDIKKVNADKKDDIVIYFIDSLRAMDVFEKQGDGYQPKLLANYLDKSIVFTNARSTGVTTYESMVSVIRQIHPYDSNVYDNNIMFEFEEFDLLNVANSLNYEIRFYASEGYPIIKPTNLIHFTPQVYMTEKLWTLACDMAESNRKTLNFVYFPYELHFPLICGYHTEEPQVSGFVDVGVENTSKFVERQLGECLSYVDRQMEYYRTFFSDDILMALFSDHSQVVYDNKEQKPYFMYYNNIQRSVGVTFFIKGHGLQQQWNENLVSLIDFNTMMKSILCEGALNIPNHEVVQYQYYKIHYKKLREIAMEQGLTDYIDGMNCYTSKEYIYIVTKTGVEEVYRVNDTKSNIIATVEGQAFRDMVKQNYKISFPDFL